MYRLLFFHTVNEFLASLPDTVQAKIRVNARTMQSGNFQSVYVKTLRGPIRELIVKEYRVLFFIKHNVICFVHAFQKKAAKTPLAEIERAMRVYKMMKD